MTEFIISSCCGYSLETGAKVIAWWQLIICSVSLVFYVNPVFKDDPDVEDLFKLLYLIMGIILGGLLLFSIKHKLHYWIRLYMYWRLILFELIYIYVCSNIIYNVILMCILLSYESEDMLFMGIYITISLIELYLMIVVHNCMLEIKHLESNQQEEEETTEL